MPASVWTRHSTKHSRWKLCGNVSSQLRSTRTRALFGATTERLTHVWLQAVTNGTRRRELLRCALLTGPRSRVRYTLTTGLPPLGGRVRKRKRRTYCVPDAALATGTRRRPRHPASLGTPVRWRRRRSGSRRRRPCHDAQRDVSARNGEQAQRAGRRAIRVERSGSGASSARRHVTVLLTSGTADTCARCLLRTAARAAQ